MWRDVALVLTLSTTGGLVGAGLWRWLWTPLEGTVLRGVWYPATNASDFSATGIYVLVGLGVGLLLGVVSALVTERRELLTLGLVLVGSVLAAGVMLWVGQLGMPPDPRRLAETTADRAQLPGTLMVIGWSPLAAIPAGALAGLCVVFIGVSRKVADEQHDSDLPG